MRTKYTQGFTLVELSIVLIIIGLIIAGVTSGSSLIKSATLNSVIADFKGYQSAYNSFVSRYGQAPGDYNDAINTWGTACNGNNDGIIGSASSSNEAAIAMYELSMAGMIKDSILPLINCFWGGFNKGYLPESKIKNGLYWMANGSDAVLMMNRVGAYNSGFWALGAGNVSTTNAIALSGGRCGVNVTGPCAQVPRLPIITGLDASSIDIKGDDGAPNTGTIRASDAEEAAQANCVLGGSGAAATGYNKTQAAQACIIAMSLNE